LGVAVLGVVVLGVFGNKDTNLELGQGDALMPQWCSFRVIPYELTEGDVPSGHFIG
jgi:hypothetical protein